VSGTWDWHESESVVGECDQCGKDNVRVRYEVDPFISEIWPDDENTPSMWCYECWGNRKDEV